LSCCDASFMGDYQAVISSKELKLFVGWINVGQNISCARLFQQVTYIVRPSCVVIRGFVMIDVGGIFVHFNEGEAGRVIFVLQYIKSDTARLLACIAGVVQRESLEGFDLVCLHVKEYVEYMHIRWGRLPP